jgi:alpha-tubulin suppressor-like RCC1 family protein
MLVHLRHAPLALIASLVVAGCGGDDATEAPVVSLGAAHTCAVLPSGKARCWGLNGFGEVGDGAREVPLPSPVQLGYTLAGIGAAGCDIMDDDTDTTGGHSCAVTDAGEVLCWGAIDYADAEDDVHFPPAHRTPTKVAGIATATSISAGTFSNCALLQDRTAMCWGLNLAGQLGDGTLDEHAAAVKVEGLSNIVSLDVGGSHACAVTADGKVWCWGGNDDGQLGDGTTMAHPHPTEVPGVSKAIAVSAGGERGWGHTCALIEDGTVWCWGGNSLGQLGRDGDSSAPAAVAALSGVTSIATGYAHTCAVLSDGTAKCWGYAALGQLGDGTAGLDPNPEPRKVSHLKGVKSIAAGGGHTCAVTVEGDEWRVWCWGSNKFGQIGNGQKGGMGVTAPTQVLAPEQTP